MFIYVIVIGDFVNTKYLQVGVGLINVKLTDT
jgi:hypothetical protein